MNTKLFQALLCLLSVILLCQMRSYAQLPNKVLPLDPGSGLNISGPADAVNVLPGAPRIVAKTYNLSKKDERLLLDSTRYIYSSPTARMYHQSFSFWHPGMPAPYNQNSLSSFVFDSLSGAVHAVEHLTGDGIAGRFKPTGKTVYLRDAAGRAYEALHHKWDSTGGEYVPYQKRSDKFNEAGYIMERSVSNWDDQKKSWTMTERVVYTRNGQHYTTSEERRYWSAQGKPGDRPTRQEYAYDRSGRVLMSHQLLSWNAGEQRWAPNYRSTFTRHTQGKPASLIQESFYPSNQTWDTASRISYSYDAEGNLVEELHERYKKRPQQFVKNHREVMVYNRFHQLLSKDKQMWKADGWSTEHSNHSNTYYE